MLDINQSCAGETLQKLLPNQKLIEKIVQNSDEFLLPGSTTGVDFDKLALFLRNNNILNIQLGEMQLITPSIPNLFTKNILKITENVKNIFSNTDCIGLLFFCNRDLNDSSSEAHMFGFTKVMYQNLDDVKNNEYITTNIMHVCLLGGYYYPILK